MFCRARLQSEVAAAQPVLFPYRGSQPHSCYRRLLLLPPTFFFFFSSSSPPRRLLTPPLRAPPPPPPRRMMPSHSGISNSRTRAPLPPPHTPNGQASLVRSPRPRGAGTRGEAAAGAAAAAAAATRAGGPSRNEAVRSGDGRGETSSSRGSSKGTGLIPSACPGLNQLGGCGGEKRRGG